MSAAFAGPEPDVYPRSRSDVNALPYAQLGVRIGDASPGIMVLRAQSLGQNYWASANRLQIVTAGNRIVATRGLPKDLQAMQALGTDPFVAGADDPNSLDGLIFERLVSIAPGDQKRVLARSTLTVEGPEAVDILDFSTETIRVREDVVVADWQWRTANTYWLSLRSPLAWRSVQTLHPDTPSMRLEILKRPPSA